MAVKNKFSLSIGIGAPSLMVIFLIVSMISFSVLSYMTARADYRYSLNLKERTTAYYLANNQGEEKIAQIHAILSEVYQTSEDADSFYTNAILALSAYEPDPIRHSLTLRVKIREIQDLQITLLFHYPKEGIDSFFTITEWIVIHTGEWEPDNVLELMEGENP